MQAEKHIKINKNTNSGMHINRKEKDSERSRNRLISLDNTQHTQLKQVVQR